MKGEDWRRKVGTREQQLYLGNRAADSEFPSIAISTYKLNLTW